MGMDVVDRSAGAEILCDFGTWKIFASDIINNE